MAVRPIDGNELYRIEKLLDTDIVRQDKVALNLLEQVLYDIQHVPTLTPPNEWVSVEERLPNPKQNVLAYSPKSGIAEADYADGVWMQYRWSAVMDGVTYWMPLPAPPAKEDQK